MSVDDNVNECCDTGKWVEHEPRGKKPYCTLLDHRDKQIKCPYQGEAKALNVSPSYMRLRMFYLCTKEQTN